MPSPRGPLAWLLGSLVIPALLSSTLSPTSSHIWDSESQIGHQFALYLLSCSASPLRGSNAALLHSWFCWVLFCSLLWIIGSLYGRGSISSAFERATFLLASVYSSAAPGQSPFVPLLFTGLIHILIPAFETVAR